MTMSAAGSGMLPTNRRKPLLRTFLHLYRGEFAFQGMVDFAVIGAAVLLFLHPPSKDDLRSWLSLVGIGADRSSTISQPPVATTAPPQRPVAQLPAVKPAVTPSAPAVTPSAPAVTPQPAPASPQVAQPAQPSKPVVFPQEIAKPTLANTMLVEISETAFRNSHATDQQRLLAARFAYRSGRGREIVDLLADADGRDPNVAFMRGLGLMVRGDEASVKAGEAVLRTAAEANHTLAKVLLGRMLVTAPKGITKNVDEGRRLIEAATATGDPQAQRVAAIAYISAEFGSFDPGRAASLFKRAAEAGDPQAMFHYARVLSEGIGVPASQADAMDFLGRAAGAGLTSAQFALGAWQLDQYGANALSDPAEGVAWLERAMQRGFSLLALNKLQHLYGWMGREAPWNDKARYFALAKQCSGLADPYCQYSYSIASSNGWGGTRDPFRAYVHALIARDLGHASVTAKIIDDLGATLTSRERADATERARALRQKLKPALALVVFQYSDVNRPSPWASVEEIEGAAPQQQTPQPPSPAAVASTAAEIPFAGYMSKPDGFYYWTISFDPAAFNDRPPQLRAALQAALAAYKNKQAQAVIDALQNADAADPAVNLLKAIALLVLRDEQPSGQFAADAVRYLRTAASAGDNKAAAILGDLLRLNDSKGIAKDIPRARELAEQAGRSNDAFAVRQLAIGVLSGAFGASDPTRAADLMWTSAELGDPVANVMVAAFFQNGTGVPRDADKAEKYLRRAADLGLTGAQEVLGEWIIKRYSNRLISSPEEGVRVLERAYNDGRSLWAVWRLAVLYDFDGREPPWRDRPKALEFARRCAPYSHQDCHVSLGVIYRNLGDMVRSWAHYDVARGLGFDGAGERLDGLEKSMTKNEMENARNLSQTMRRDLKPVPAAIEIQDANARRTPSSSAALPPAVPVSSSNYADELTDWGIPPQTSLKYDVGSRTPMELPGARRITTDELRQLGGRALLVDVLDVMGHSTIPGAIHIPGGGDYGRGGFDDSIQKKLSTLLSGMADRGGSRPLVFFCEGALCWESYNAALRAINMGYRNVLWYRGGLASWKAANLSLASPASVHRIK